MNIFKVFSEKLTTGDSHIATAFLCSRYGHLLSCGHGFSHNKLSEGNLVVILGSDEREYSATIIEFIYEKEKHEDVVLLHCHDLENKNFIDLKRVTQFQNNKRVVILGYGRDDFSSLQPFSGTISGEVISLDTKKAKIVKIDIENGPNLEGLSGSPVFFKSNENVCIGIQILQGSSGASYILPISSLCRLSKKILALVDYVAARNKLVNYLRRFESSIPRKEHSGCFYIYLNSRFNEDRYDEVFNRIRSWIESFAGQYSVKISRNKNVPIVDVEVSESGVEDCEKGIYLSEFSSKYNLNRESILFDTSLRITDDEPQLREGYLERNPYLTASVENSDGELEISEWRTGPNIRIRISDEEKVYTAIKNISYDILLEKTLFKHTPIIRDIFGDDGTFGILFSEAKKTFLEYLDNPKPYGCTAFHNPALIPFPSQVRSTLTDISNVNDTLDLWNTFISKTFFEMVFSEDTKNFSGLSGDKGRIHREMRRMKHLGGQFLGERRFFKLYERKCKGLKDPAAVAICPRSVKGTDAEGVYKSIFGRKNCVQMATTIVSGYNILKLLKYPSYFKLYFFIPSEKE